MFSLPEKRLMHNILVIIILYTYSSSSQVIEKSRFFEVDYENSRFLMDGEPFQYVSGEVHYFRIPNQYWKDRLLKLRAAGLNTVSTYVEWSQHEPSQMQFNFEGDLDIVNFIQIAQSVGLYVILRPGPYICAERDFGGYPSWLLTVNPNMKLRTSDASHTFFIERWFKHLMPKLQPLLYGNGGPIIMVQVENEYGSYPVNDLYYLIWLRDLYRSYIRDAAVLFTTDGPGSSTITRGRIPGVLTTIDFGPGTNDVNKTFSVLRKLQPKAPLVNSEFYVGWLTYWGEEFSGARTSDILVTMNDLLRNNVSFNMYMFHGGTNFGFTAGSGSSKYFQPDITSYDYDAPISEAGDLTEKYDAIKGVLTERFGPTNIIVTSPQKGDYGTVELRPVISLFSSPVEREALLSEYPKSFEEIGQRYGFVSYQTTVVATPKDPSVLQVNVRDRAVVYLDQEEISVLQYTVINETPLPPTLERGQTLTLLIENLGRRNYKMLSDCTKGLISNATIDGVILKDWIIKGYPLNAKDVLRVESLVNGNDTNAPIKFPGYFHGRIQLDEGVEPLDTFLDMSGWGKGVVFVNGFNLGRYWQIGPQVTLYTPGCYLHPFPAYNNITVLELHFAHPQLTVSFTTTPILNKTSSLDLNVYTLKVEE